MRFTSMTARTLVPTVAWLLVSMPVAAQQGAAPRDSAPRVPVAADPLRGDRDRLGSAGAHARTQQDQFERNHRSGLRFYNGGADARCEVDLGGNLCYWNNNGDVPPPDERNDAKLERFELLQVLKEAQQADPKDDWVSGMRVRYALEAGELDTAAMAAKACDGTAWWCAALEGLAAHSANRHDVAARAFARSVVAPRVRAMDAAAALDPAVLSGLFSAGLMGISKTPVASVNWSPAAGTNRALVASSVTMTLPKDTTAPLLSVSTIRR